MKTKKKSIQLHIKKSFNNNIRKFLFKGFTDNISLQSDKITNGIVLKNYI